MKISIISFFIVAIAALSSCNAPQAEAVETEQSSTTETKVVEDKVNAESTTESTTESETEKTSNTTGKPIKLSKKDFLEKVMNFEKNPKDWVFEGDLPCVIDFYADWCGPCRQAAPILDELAKEYAGKINVYKIDTQVEQELASAFGIQSIPAFLYCPKNGKPTMAQGIGRTKEDTKKMFVEAIESILLENKTK